MIAVFYHCIVSGGSVPIDTEHACAVIHEQMQALAQSGLAAACSELVIGINGTAEDAQIVRMFTPAKAQLRVHGPGTTTEIPTLNLIRAWLPGHEAWHVMYHHLKGVTHPGEPAYAAWRRRMQKYVVESWRVCVNDLAASRILVLSATSSG